MQVVSMILLVDENNILRGLKHLKMSTDSLTERQPKGFLRLKSAHGLIIFINDLN